MIGLGLQSAGTSPAGVGASTSVEPLPSTAKGARYIDYTGNPVLDPVNGGFMKADPVAMRVYLAIRTTLKSSSASQSLGTQWPRKIDSRFVSSLDSSIRTALASMVSAGDIVITSIVATYPQPERFTIVINYQNLNTQKSEQVTVGNL